MQRLMLACLRDRKKTGMAGGSPNKLVAGWEPPDLQEQHSVPESTSWATLAAKRSFSPPCARFGENTWFTVVFLLLLLVSPAGVVSLGGKFPRGGVLGTPKLIELRWEDTHCRPLDLLLSPFQCHFCDKAFMNQAFLQSHIQRRHPEDSHLGKSQAQLQRVVFLWVPFSFFSEPWSRASLSPLKRKYHSLRSFIK